MRGHPHSERECAGRHVAIDARHGSPGDRVHAARKLADINDQLARGTRHRARLPLLDVVSVRIDHVNHRQGRVRVLRERKQHSRRRLLKLRAVRRLGALQKRVRLRARAHQRESEQNERRDQGSASHHLRPALPADRAAAVEVDGRSPVPAHARTAPIRSWPRTRPSP